MLSSNHTTAQHVKLKKYLNVYKNSMIGLIQWLVTLGFQWNLKRKFSLAIWRKPYSHSNPSQKNI